jgi:hypothetical protein
MPLSVNSPTGSTVKPFQPPAERAVITVLVMLGAETLRANLALPIAIGILVDLSLRNALSQMMTLIARHHASFFGNRTAE